MISVNGCKVILKEDNTICFSPFSDFSNTGINIFKLIFESDLDIALLQFAKEYIDTVSPCTPCILYLPYVPYSRMDRQECNRLFTLKSFTSIINNMCFASVNIYEPHSEVCVALLDRVVVVNKSLDLALLAMQDVLSFRGDTLTLLSAAVSNDIYLVYPDGGAASRYTAQLSYPKILTCSKERDFNSGNITSITLNDTFGCESCKIAIIVDDLCSRGGTFIGTASALSAKLPNIEKIILCVTHSENTIFDGFVLSGSSFYKVYTTDSLLCVPPDFTDSKLVIQTLF